MKIFKIRLALVFLTCACFCTVLSAKSNELTFFSDGLWEHFTPQMEYFIHELEQIKVVSGQQAAYDEFLQAAMTGNWVGSPDDMDFVFEYCRNIYAGTERDAILISNGGLEYYVLLYLQSLQGVRSDVALLRSDFLTDTQYLEIAMTQPNIGSILTEVFWGNKTKYMGADELILQVRNYGYRVNYTPQCYTPGISRDSLVYVGITMRYSYSDSDAALATFGLAMENSFSFSYAEKYWPDVHKSSWAVIEFNYINRWIKCASELRELGIELTEIEKWLLNPADSALSNDYRYVIFRFRWALDNNRKDILYWEDKILEQLDTIPENFIKEYLPEFNDK